MRPLSLSDLSRHRGREGGGGREYSVGFPVPRSPCHAFSAGSAAGSRRSLRHPLCRHYCHRHCALGSVVPRSSPAPVVAPPDSSLRFVTLSLSPLTASCDVPRDVNEISGTHVNKKKAARRSKNSEASDTLRLLEASGTCSFVNSVFASFF